MLKLIIAGTTYGTLYTKYPTLKTHLGTNAPTDDVVFNKDNAVGQMTESFVAKQVANTKEKNFVELKNPAERLLVVTPLMVSREDVKSQGLSQKEIETYVRVAFSSDAPDRKQTDGNGGYIDYSNKKYAWRVAFDVITDVNGNDLPFTSELRDKKVSMSYDSKMYDQYSILAVGDMLKLRIKTSTTHKFYETIDSFKNLFKGNDTLTREQEVEIQELWDAHSVTKNGITYVCMVAPKRESKFDLNQNNLGTPTRLSGRDLVKATRFAKMFDTIEESTVANKEKMAQYKNGSEVRALEDEILMERAAKLVETAAKFGEVISILDAYERVAKA